MFLAFRKSAGFVAFVVLLLPFAFGACSSENSTAEGDDTADSTDDEGILEVPFQIEAHFEPSLWGEADRISLDSSYSDLLRDGDDDKKCIRIHYDPGEKAWGAVYWQPKRSLGVRKPVKIESAEKVSFWAKGETGNEVVDFRSNGSPAVDLIADRNLVSLTPEWKYYELKLEDEKLEEVAGAFGLKLKAVTKNPEGITFYLDDIRYQ